MPNYKLTVGSTIHYFRNLDYATIARAAKLDGELVVKLVNNAAEGDSTPIRDRSDPQTVAILEPTPLLFPDQAVALYNEGRTIHLSTADIEFNKDRDPVPNFAPHHFTTPSWMVKPSIAEHIKEAIGKTVHLSIKDNGNQYKGVVLNVHEHPDEEDNSTQTLVDIDMGNGLGKGSFLRINTDSIAKIKPKIKPKIKYKITFFSSIGGGHLKTSHIFTDGLDYGSLRTAYAGQGREEILPHVAELIIHRLEDGVCKDYIHLGGPTSIKIEEVPHDTAAP